MAKITIQNTNVTIITITQNDYISLTDIAKYKSEGPTAVIGNWMRNRNTIEYLGIWESLYNPHFNPLEFEGVKRQAGLNEIKVLFNQSIMPKIGAISKSPNCYQQLYTNKHNIRCLCIMPIQNN